MTITDLLPRARNEQRHAGNAAAHPADRWRGVSARPIMVVDDDPRMGTLVALMIEACGRAQAVCFQDPRAALKAFQADPEAWELVITDFHMPGLTGRELASLMREQRSDLPLVLMSGAANGVEACAGLCQPFEFLPKPFAGAALAQAMAAVIGRLENTGAICC